MKTDPYDGISPQVVDTVKRVLLEADDYHQAHVTRLARTIEILVDKNSSGKMLELGTSGFVPIVCSELLPNLEIEATCLVEDDSPFSLDADFIVGSYSKTIKCHGLDLEYDQIPVEDETYDIVLCCEVLEHMEIDPMFMLAEVNRVLKTTGTLVLTTPNIVSSRGLTKMVNGIEPYFFMHYHRTREMHRHNYEYSPDGVRKILRAAGFDALVWTEDLFEDGITSVVDALRAAGFVIEEVGDNIIAVCKKVSPVIDRYPSGMYA
jgi:SAM-dependent methyltransferase